MFLETFGDTPILRVLDFLIVNEDFDYSMTDIADNSEVGYATLKIFWPRLEKNNIIILTRTIGKAKLYKLNVANPVIKKFKEFYWETTKQKISAKVKKTVAIVR